MKYPQPHPRPPEASQKARLLVRKTGDGTRQVDVTGRISVGRAFDNVIVVDETCVSRYHALIEERPDGFWVTDLGSINGTSVNGQPVKTERKLRGDDEISFGGATVLQFLAENRPIDGHVPARGAADGSRPQSKGASPPPQASFNSSRTAIVIVAILAPIIIIGSVALVLSGAFRSSGFSDAPIHDAPIHIVGVQTGDNITGPARIRTDAPSGQDILQVIYQLDDVELARVRVPPFETELDPQRLTAVVPGLFSSNHVLSLIIEDKAGRRRLQPDKIVLSFAGASAGSQSTPADPAIEPTGTTAVLSGKDISYMADSLVRQISRRNQNLSPEFVQAILLATRDYRFNFVDDARRYNPREIANAFSNKGLDPLLGFALAMSRSKFRLTEARDSGGLWLIPGPVIAEFASGQERASLQDPKRSAELAATYSKALLGLFDPDDFLYAIACFGMTTMQAGEIRAALNTKVSQSDRQDFWRIVNSDLFPKESGSRVAQFFAAGIVGEYPAKFGLHWTPLSSLYN